VDGGDGTAAGRWRNPWKDFPRWRWAVQLSFLAFLLWTGAEFHAYYLQVLSGGAVTASRPPAVEAFLPISALAALKRLVLTGTWDPVHPAGLAILSAAIVMSLAARKSFCSWVCPVGTLSRALEALGRVALWRRRKAEILVPRWADLPLSSLKYLVLAFFAWAILWNMSVADIEGFLDGPYNRAVDARMLLFFLRPSAFALGTIGALALLSVVVKNAWCRYLCPYGALLGLGSWLSPVRVARDPDACIDCRKCTAACPSEIRVHGKERVLTPECTGCLSCVSACPAEGCLGVTRRGAAAWPPWVVPAAGLGILFLAWGAARLSGHWETSLSPAELAEAYRRAREIGHP
jgi:polyferredoxin